MVKHLKTKEMEWPYPLRWGQRQNVDADALVLGTTFKPALFRECKRLGVHIFDRTMATLLLTEGGKQGVRVVGAVGINGRTGELVAFRAKATVLCMSRPSRIWLFSSGLPGRRLQNFTHEILMNWSGAWKS